MSWVKKMACGMGETGAIGVSVLAVWNVPEDAFSGKGQSVQWLPIEVDARGGVAWSSGMVSTCSAGASGSEVGGSTASVGRSGEKSRCKRLVFLELGVKNVKSFESGMDVSTQTGRQQR